MRLPPLRHCALTVALLVAGASLLSGDGSARCSLVDEKDQESSHTARPIVTAIERTLKALKITKESDKMLFYQILRMSPGNSPDAVRIVICSDGEAESVETLTYRNLDQEKEFAITFTRAQGPGLKSTSAVVTFLRIANNAIVGDESIWEFRVSEAKWRQLGGAALRGTEVP